MRRLVPFMLIAVIWIGLMAAAIPAQAADPSQGPTPAPTPIVPPNALSISVVPFPGNQTATALIGTRYLAVRDAPSKRGKGFSYVIRGQIVIVYALDSTRSWGLIRMPDGRFGWISLAFTSFNPLGGPQ